MIANHWVSWLNHWVKQNSCLQFPHRYILSWTSRGGTHQQTCTIVNLSMACYNKSEPEVSHSSSETSDPTHTDSFLANCCTKGWLKYGSHNALQSTLLHFATQAATPQRIIFCCCWLLLQRQNYTLAAHPAKQQLMPAVLKYISICPPHWTHIITSPYNTYWSGRPEHLTPTQQQQNDVPV